MASKLSNSLPEIPSIVLIGVADKKALEKVIDKLVDNGIGFSDFYETDGGVGLSAVATVPVAGAQRDVLRNYRLWNESTFNTHTHSSVAERRDSRKAYPEVGGSIPSACAKNGQVVQLCRGEDPCCPTNTRESLDDAVGEDSTLALQV
jgi:hypothetical protein